MAYLTPEKLLYLKFIDARRGFDVEDWIYKRRAEREKAKARREIKRRRLDRYKRPLDNQVNDFERQHNGASRYELYHGNDNFRELFQRSKAVEHELALLDWEREQEREQERFDNEMLRNLHQWYVIMTS